jgi:hypothetical protein
LGCAYANTDSYTNQHGDPNGHTDRHNYPYGNTYSDPN